MEDEKNVPQRLKPGMAVAFAARLKPCPSFKTEFSRELFWPQLMYPERSAALETRLPGIEKLRKSHEPLEKYTTRAKARNFIAQFLSGFEDPLPRTKVRGYTRTSVFPQAVKLCPFLKAEFACELFCPQLVYPERFRGFGNTLAWNRRSCGKVTNRLRSTPPGLKPGFLLPNV